MNIARVLGTSLMACVLGVAGCASTAEDDSNTATAAFSEPREIFGTDLDSPNVMATADCADFGVLAGDLLQVSAEEDWFSVRRFAVETKDQTPIFQASVPQQANYVWEQDVTALVTDKIVSTSLGVEATRDDRSDAITLTKLKIGAKACVLKRCPAYGVCEL